ncbi:MAG: hypothetical protein EOP04_10315, partial [Proteobacteria bacterium]
MKCLVLGAGATAFCDIANPARRPPLLNKKDFERMFKEGDGLSSTTSPAGYSHYNPFFIWAINEYSADLEQMFTELFYVSTLPHNVDVDELKFLANQKFGGRVATLAEQVSNATGVRLGGVGSRNLLEFFSGALHSEIANCLGTNGSNPITPSAGPISLDHKLLARHLNAADSIVNYNYDDTMGYALVNENRLDRTSFKNPLIVSVKIQNPYTSINPVKLITPHGSFTWRHDINARGGHAEVHFGEVPIEGTYGAFTPLILPYKCKDLVLRTSQIASEEFGLSMEAYALSDEVILIGKQFLNVDEDLNNFILNATRAKTRKLILVDPQVSDSRWVEAHKSLFNANKIEKYEGLSGS